MRYLILAVLLTGCATTPVQTPVTVQGPPVYIPIPEGLLTCTDVGEPPGKGMALADLYAWARLTRTEAIMCQARLAEARALAKVPE